MTQTSHTTERRLVSAREAATYLGVSARTLWSLTASGEIPHVRIRRRVLYDLSDLDAQIARWKQEAVR